MSSPFQHNFPFLFSEYVSWFFLYLFLYVLTTNSFQILSLPVGKIVKCSLNFILWKKCHQNPNHLLLMFSVVFYSFCTTITLCILHYFGGFPISSVRFSLNIAPPSFDHLFYEANHPVASHIHTYKKKKD